eukprot:PhM_4_TR6082/c0_g1_i1/m.74623/K07179/RIOK2; RIO kinase 2
MVKLDATILQYLEEEDFRVLSAVEMAIRNHELAPVELVERIANLPRGGAGRRLRELLRHKLLHHDRQLYDGYSMKYSGYDYLALHVFRRRGVLTGIGKMVGCGKESDIYVGCDGDGNELIIKLERLGRCSFRSVTRNRNYTKSTKRRGANWFYLSRLAATKEFAFMQALYEEGYPVPKPIDHNRHAIVMEKINGTVLVSVEYLSNPSKLFHQCMDVLVRFAQDGLIHGDFNEFNLMVTRDTEELIVIDFPQMVSTQHKNAADLFERDVKCIHTFFQKRYKLFFDYWPTLTGEGQRVGNLDVRIARSKFSDVQQKDLDRLARDNDEEEEAEEGDEEEEGEEVEELEEKENGDDNEENGEEVQEEDPEEEEEGEEETDEVRKSDRRRATEERDAARNRPRVIAVPVAPNIDVRRVRGRVKQEGESREFRDVQHRATHRNQFKTKDRRVRVKAMKEMRDAHYDY